MANRGIRVYADTSVFGGVYDEEFEKYSRRFFELVRAGYFQLVISVIVKNEIAQAPENVRLFFSEMLEFAEVIESSSQAEELQEAYLKAKILMPQCGRDAMHVALASISDCAIIISWNFKHIVNFRKIPLYNAINMSMGYKTIAIYSPREVIEDEA